MVIHERALASLRPCEMYLDHGSARPAYTQGHHARPEYLQKRLWGEVRDQTLTWLCGTCHDNLHGAVYILFGERQGDWAAIPQRARSAAYDVQRWFMEQSAA